MPVAGSGSGTGADVGEGSAGGSLPNTGVQLGRLAIWTGLITGAGFMFDRERPSPSVHAGGVARAGSADSPTKSEKDRLQGSPAVPAPKTTSPTAVLRRRGEPTRSALPGRAFAPWWRGWRRWCGFAGLHNPTSNDRTRELLGWEPTHPGWVEEVQTGHYFG
jgi:hypothetical protein